MELLYALQVLAVLVFYPVLCLPLASKLGKKGPQQIFYAALLSFTLLIFLTWIFSLLFGFYTAILIATTLLVLQNVLVFLRWNKNE